jgi:8-oxo-dGTP pyrophosphatase MutT (NUDIX family)
VNAPRAGNIRPAASVLVLRDGARGVEVLLMRRPERGDNDFRSGACVFPGGVLDAGDRDSWRWCLGLDDAKASARLGLPEGGLDYFVAALRECFEEVGLLFVCRSDGTAADLAPHAEALRDWRHRLHRGEATMAALCESFDWRLDLREMAYFSHWLTPVVRPKRFDTRFFVRLAPPGQDAKPDFGEALELMWLTPDEALDPQRALKLLNVTQRTLKDIHGFDSARAAFEHALALRGVALHFPRPALGRDGPRFVIESDPSYEEVARLDPEGRGVVRCELAAGEVVQLSPRLWRICGAAGQAHLVADSVRSEAALIDADATDVAQMQALRALAPPPLRHLLSTRHAAGLDPVLRAAFAQAAWQPGTGARLQLGADCTLRVVDGGIHGLAYAIEQDGIAVADAAWADPVAPGTAWLAPTRGFMRRMASG